MAKCVHFSFSGFKFVYKHLVLHTMYHVAKTLESLSGPVITYKLYRHTNKPIYTLNHYSSLSPR